MIIKCVGRIALFCKAWAAGWLVWLWKCVQCALAEIFKNAKWGIFMFSLGLIVFNIIRLCYCLCCVSPVIKLDRAAAYWLFLTIANLLAFFFACAPTARLCGVRDLNPQTFQPAVNFIKCCYLQITTKPRITYSHCCAIVLSFLSSVRGERHTY